MTFYSGAGMGGLVLGLCLKKYAPDVHFDIYESASELTEVGAGIGMTHRIWSIMEELGIQDELVAITGTRDRNGTSPDLFECRRLLNVSGAVGFPLNYRKADENPYIELFQLPQRMNDQFTDMGMSHKTEIFHSAHVPAGGPAAAPC